MIYFIQCHCPARFIKIGHGRNIQERLGDLQRACPYELAVMRVLPGHKPEEAALHARFAHLKVRREWFRPGPDLMAYITETATDCLGTSPPKEKPDPDYAWSRAAGNHARAEMRMRRLREIANQR